MTSRRFFSWAVADLFGNVTIGFILNRSATNWSFSPFFNAVWHIWSQVKVSSGNLSGLGLRIFASILFKVNTFAESNRVRMVADWRQNQPKGTKNLPQVGASDSLGIFPPIRQGFEPVMFSTNSKTKNLPKILHGACAWNWYELSKPPSGFGIRNLIYVVDEPDAFNLNIEVRQSKSNKAGNGLGLLLSLIKCKKQLHFL